MIQHSRKCREDEQKDPIIWRCGSCTRGLLGARFPALLSTCVVFIVRMMLYLWVLQPDFQFNMWYIIAKCSHRRPFKKDVWYLKSRIKQREEEITRETGREIFYLLIHSPTWVQMSATISAGSDKTQKLHPRLPHGCRGPKDLGCLLLLFQVYLQEIRSEIGQIGLESLPMWEAAAYPTMPQCHHPPIKILFKVLYILFTNIPKSHVIRNRGVMWGHVCVFVHFAIELMGTILGVTCLNTFTIPWNNFPRQ